MQKPSIVSWNLDLNNNIINLTWINNSLATKSTTIYNDATEEMAHLDDDGALISFFDDSLSPNTTSEYTVTSSDIKGDEASSDFDITPIKLPNLTAKLDESNALISWEKHP